MASREYVQQLDKEKSEHITSSSLLKWIDVRKK